MVVLRKNGSDGVVTVDFTTVELDKTEHTATPGIDYETISGVLTFEHGETRKTINIKILDRPTEEVRDESFGV